jgi:hypothetical protein
LKYTIGVGETENSQFSYIYHCVLILIKVFVLFLYACDVFFIDYCIFTGCLKSSVTTFYIELLQQKPCPLSTNLCSRGIFTYGESIPARIERWKIYYGPVLMSTRKMTIYGKSLYKCQSPAVSVTRSFWCQKTRMRLWTQPNRGLTETADFDTYATIFHVGYFGL